MTALQWMTSYRHINVHHVGKAPGADGFCWALVTADVDGGELRVIQNLPHGDCVEAMRDPARFWDHPMVQKSGRGAADRRDSQPRLV